MAANGVLAGRYVMVGLPLIDNGGLATTPVYSVAIAKLPPHICHYDTLAHRVFQQ